MQIAVDPVHLDRFGQALEELGVEPHERLLLAVSGGPDSVALLLLANAIAAERIVVATVDHQLRKQSADEADFVAQLSAGMHLTHVTLVPKQKIGGNIQSSARTARYELLHEAADAHRCALIATAHHADDQLETVLMRLARGSGVNGLAGIRARNGRIIRPLLPFGKSELEDICAAAGIRPVEDPSNANPEFDRVAIRQWLAAAPHPFNTQATNRTAAALDEAATALDWMADALGAERIKVIGDGSVALEITGLPKEMCRRLLLRALRLIDSSIAPRGDAIGRLLADLHHGKTVTIGDILCKGGTDWQFTKAPARRTNI